MEELEQQWEVTLSENCKQCCASLQISKETELNSSTANIGDRDGDPITHIDNIIL